MYLATIGEQSRIFFYSVGMGFLLGVFYCCLEFIGFFMPEKRRFVIPRDIFFMIFSGFIVFLFALAINKGKMEFHIYSGIAAGFFICFFTLRRILNRVGRASARWITSFLKNFKRRILTVTKKIRRKGKEKVKKSEISSNLLLQDDESMLYNREDNDPSGRGEEE